MCSPFDYTPSRPPPAYSMYDDDDVITLSVKGLLRDSDDEIYNIKTTAGLGE